MPPLAEVRVLTGGAWKRRGRTDRPASATPAPATTIFGINTAENGTFNQTLAGRKAWWDGRAPCVRRYHTGMLPASFAQGVSVAPEKRACVSFQAESSGTYTVNGLASGAGNSRITTWAEDIPANTYVLLVYRHEMNLNLDKITPTQFVDTYTHIRDAIDAATLNSGVTLKLAANYSAYQLTTNWSDSWVPSPDVIDMFTMDIYFNPGNFTTQRTGPGYGTTYPNVVTRWRDTFAIIERTGFADHWGILEHNAPARDWDTRETTRAQVLVDSVEHALHPPMTGSVPPEIFLFWEQIEQPFAKWDQSFGRVSGNPLTVANALKPYIVGTPVGG